MIIFESFPPVLPDDINFSARALNDELRDRDTSAYHKPLWDTGFALGRVILDVCIGQTDEFFDKVGEHLAKQLPSRSHPVGSGLAAGLNRTKVSHGIDAWTYVYDGFGNVSAERAEEPVNV